MSRTREFHHGLLVDTDADGNVLLSMPHCDLKDKEYHSGDPFTVRLLGFESKVLRAFTELKVDEKLSDVNEFAKAVNVKIKEQTNKQK
jgi:S-adenosylmethionine hydrolase